MISRNAIKLFPTRICPFTRSLATSAGAAESDPTGYCKAHVQKHDYESFLTAQFYPREAQAGYFALRAFHVRVFIYC